MHKTLLRQLKHHIGDTTVLSQSWKEFLDAISITYDDFDKDRTLIERSLNISSAELKDLIALLQATLNSTTDGILVVGIGNVILHYNKKLLEILGISENVIATHDAEKITASILDRAADPEAVIQKINAIAKTSLEESNDIIPFKDGRIIERYSKPQTVAGKSLGRVWSFRDITNQVIAENQLKTDIVTLEKLNRTMVDRELKMIELKKKIKSLEVQISNDSSAV